MIVERPGLERRVLASLEAGRIPVVLGACGTGRTSLLLRLEQALGPAQSQYLDFAAAATTPERCLAAVSAACRTLVPGAASAGQPASAREAFDAMMTLFDRATTDPARPRAFLVDEVLDLRTFESFPGLRHVQREFVARLAASRSQFVLASRFTARAHRLLRDAPARFEVVHLSRMGPQDVLSSAMRFGVARRDFAAESAAAVAVLADGRPAYVHALLDAMTSMGGADPIAALVALFMPDGRLTARCGQSYEFRLHRARGYGALKAILGILADDEPMNLTEIAQHLHRTPGSTKDYLSWLEDVDLITSQGKRYAIEDPLVRLYIRLYGRAVPPGQEDVVRAIQTYAQARLPRAAERPEPALAAVDRVAERGVERAADRGIDVERPSGIIEID